MNQKQLFPVALMFAAFIVAGYPLGSVFASKLGSNNETDKLILLARAYKP